MAVIYYMGWGRGGEVIYYVGWGRGGAVIYYIGWGRGGEAIYYVDKPFTHPENNHIFDYFTLKIILII